MNPRLAGFGLAAAVCLSLYWPGLVTWFSMDDFAWLGLRLSIETPADLWAALFSPKAQGTVRPISERLYFLLFEKLFGLEALPFRLLAFATQLLNLWLALRLVERVSGARLAAALTPLVWIVNSALALAMSWSSAYNQILWPCFLLSAAHARWTWLETGRPRARYAEWAFFLIGFGVLELQVVYPAIAAALTLLYHRARWRELLPLFAVSGAYTVFNRAMARPAASPVYQLYWDADIAATFWTYLRMATGMWRPNLVRAEDQYWLYAELLVGLAFLAGLAWLAWKRERLALFGLAWFAATLAPILPLKNHISDYYMTVPALGLAMVAAAAAARRPALAAIPLAVYLAGSGYWARRTVDYNCDRAEQGRVLFAGIQEAARLHPGKAILLTAVSSEQYWGVMNDNPFRLVPGLRVHLAPGGDENIEKHPDLGDPGRYILPGPAARGALEKDQAVVYSPAGGRLRNVTALWRQLARERWGGELATAVDVGQPLLAGQLDEGWYEIEQGFRWAQGRAALRLGPPPADAREIALEAFRGGEDGRRAAVTLVLSLNGVEAGRWQMPSENSSLAVAAPIPPALDRARPVKVSVDISPVLTEPGAGGRRLGLAFGKFAFR